MYDTVADDDFEQNLDATTDANAKNKNDCKGQKDCMKLRTTLLGDNCGLWDETVHLKLLGKWQSL